MTFTLFMKRNTAVFLTAISIILFLTSCSGLAYDPTEGLSNSATLPDKPTASPTTPPTSLPPAPATQDVSQADETAPATVPEAVWLPYGAGNYGDPILTRREGQFGYELPLTPVEVFFDYAPQHGLLAYGTQFWSPSQDGQASVTNLAVYDYDKQAETIWLRGSVGRATFSPAVGPLLAVALYQNGQFNLVVMSEPETAQPITSNIDPYFSWSPNGRVLAFVRGDSLYQLTAGAAEPERLVDGLNRNKGWLGDTPTWTPDGTAVAYPNDPFVIYDQAAGRAITPTDRDGNPLREQRPTTILLANEWPQLIGQIDGQNGPSVQIYQLSDDYQQVLDSYFLEDRRLVGWYEPNESLVVLDEAEMPLIWSLREEKYLD
jgi:hypothetical protein